ncbi:ribosomal protein L10e/L16 [Emericellopsis atlantica]|uniref:Ribosomal protein L10e/L16 n=1 Tax=Emericellopsis atlantica TaxID=2614577 RepID=A0A9P8CSL4_9HYPO|nr:ribosomal protein L10e/L16 [Emericellopsis atlantica]KAG9257472.1 ribosomal protein L10e/L16 [Emericellopsis atlantica]
MKPAHSSTLVGALRGLSLGNATALQTARATPTRALDAARRLQNARAFSTTTTAMGNWLEPKLNRKDKMAKGRPRVATGGSAKGTTVMWGDYGLRMIDHHRRISAKSLQTAESTIKARLRGEKYRLYKRKNCNIGVFVSGNDMRMGKGKGSFDHWAARIAVSQIVFEIRGKIHEAIVRDAFRLAGNKLPGQWAFAKKGDAPIVGITPLDNGLTLEELKAPRRHIAPQEMLEASSPTSITQPGSKTESQPKP